MIATTTYAPEMIRITTYITREQDDTLNALAETTGKKKSELIRDSIDSFTETNQSDDDIDAFIADFQSGFSKYLKPTFQSFADKAFSDGIGEIKPHQIQLCDRLTTYSRVIVCAPRQSGISTILCMLAAYRAASKPCNIVFGVIKEMYDTRISTTITSTFNSLSCNVKIVNATKSTITFSNNSTIKILSYGSIAFSNALSDVTNEFILDEFAYAKPVGLMESIADKLIQCCKTPHFKLFIGSVPTSAIRYSDDKYPILTHYYRLWAYAIATDSPLRAIQITSDACGSDKYQVDFLSPHRRTNEIDGTFNEVSDESFIDVIDSCDVNESESIEAIL